MSKAKAFTKLTEGVLQHIVAERVDREKGVMLGVRMGGLVSKNKREYTPGAYKKAIKDGLYEGKPCNVNHVKEGEQVSSYDRFGVWRNVRWSETPEPGPIGDLHYLKTHPLAERACEAAERSDLSGTFGMSHIADACDVSYGKNGKVIIEGIEKVKSVDLVADPATVNGLYESKEPTPMKKNAKAALLEACPYPFQKKLIESLDGLDVEIELAEDLKPVEIIKACVNHLCGKLAVDESLKPDQKGKRIAEAASVQMQLLDGPKVKEAEEDEEEEIVEAAKPISIDAAFRICEQLEFAPNQKQLKVLLKMDEATAKETAEQFAALSAKDPGQKKAFSAPRLPVEEDSKGDDAPATDHKTFAERCFG